MKKKAFTLIEMLIVIVIIGILAAALIPRLVSVQGRARDTKRKADLAQLGNGLAIYKNDNFGFPAVSGNVTFVLFTQYLSGYMTSQPIDPVSTSTLSEVGTGSTNTGYVYISVNRGGANHNGAILGAQTESDGTSSNAVQYTGLTHTTVAETFDSYIGSVCQNKATKGTAFTPGTCTHMVSGFRYYYSQ